MTTASTKRPIAEARDEALAKVRAIDGWLSEGEAGLLFDRAAAARGPIVEIGSWQGRSTAALALGSQAGNGHRVLAIDSYAGVPPSGRISAKGEVPSWESSTPQLLRANLDEAGVGDLVTILAKTSAAAVDDVASCDLLFVDGDHKYESVSQDLRLYLPKVADRGTVVVHDCWEIDPEVVRAVDEQIVAAPNAWRIRGRVDSAIWATRQSTERRKVILAAPGPNWGWGAVKGLLQASLGAHDVTVRNSSRGWDDMNLLWMEALNAYNRGDATHFAMLHSDVTPTPGWIETLLCELDDMKAALVSTVIPIKDRRGLTSTGIGDAADPWAPLRRLTMREVMTLPETFSVADTPHPDRYLLHNTGCWACDLRDPVFQTTDEQGRLRACFAFPIQSRRDRDGQWVNERESEDWYFSRQLHLLGARTFATRKVRLTHEGASSFTNTCAWGSNESDVDLKHKWQQEKAT